MGYGYGYDQSRRRVGGFSRPYMSVPVASLAAIKARLAAVQANSQPMLVDFYGQSITRDAFGAGATGHVTACVSQQFAAALAAAGYPVNTDSIVGCVHQTTGGGLSSWAAANDSRLTIGAGWVPFAAAGVGGNGFANNSTANALSLLVTKDFNSIEVRRFSRASNDGVYTLAVNGGAPSANIGGESVASVRIDTVALSGIAGDRIDMVRVSGEPDILAIRARNTALHAVEINNCGWNSSTTTSWASLTNPYSARSEIRRRDAFLAFLEFGSNNWNPTAISVASTVASLQLMIDDIRANPGPAIPWLTMSPPSDPASFADEATQATYRVAMRNLAAQNGCPWIDLTDLYGGSWAAASAGGLMGDARHQNTLGCTLWAQALAAPFV